MNVNEVSELTIIKYSGYRGTCQCSFKREVWFWYSKLDIILHLSQLNVGFIGPNLTSKLVLIYNDQYYSDCTVTACCLYVLRLAVWVN